MKKMIEEIENGKMTEPNGEIITRADALKKVGYIAVSAATMMILLGKPNQAFASPEDPPTRNGPASPSKGIW